MTTVNLLGVCGEGGEVSCFFFLSEYPTGESPLGLP